MAPFRAADLEPKAVGAQVDGCDLQLKGRCCTQWQNLALKAARAGGAMTRVTRKTAFIKNPSEIIRLGNDESVTIGLSGEFTAQISSRSTILTSDCHH